MIVMAQKLLGKLYHYIFGQQKESSEESAIYFCDDEESCRGWVVDQVR